MNMKPEKEKRESQWTSVLNGAGIVGLALLVNGGLLLLIAWANRGVEVPSRDPAEKQWTIRSVQLEDREQNQDREETRNEPEPEPQDVQNQQATPEISLSRPNMDVNTPDLRENVETDPSPFAAVPEPDMPDFDSPSSTRDAGQNTSRSETESTSSSEETGEDGTSSREPASQAASGSGRLDVKPRKTGGPRPSYPGAARRNSLEGWVLLSFSVDQNGQVHNIDVLDYEGSRLFIEAAREAVSRWSFEPGKIDGRPVTVTGIQQRIMFQLE